MKPFILYRDHTGLVQCKRFNRVLIYLHYSVVSYSRLFSLERLSEKKQMLQSGYFVKKTLSSLG